MDEIIAFAELEHAIDLPVRTYSSGMYMRLGFAVAAHLDADILLLDEVFAVGDEAFQQKCFGKIFDFKRRGGTIVFVSHDAASVEKLCERAALLVDGRLDFDGPTHDAITRYHRLLSLERDPDERKAGLREWGSGEARIDEVELLAADGSERRQFLAGEPLTLRVRIRTDRPSASPRLTYELRTDAGLLLAAGVQDAGELGWDESPGERTLRFDVDRLPLTDGRFQLRFGLTDQAGDHLYHWLDDATASSSIPTGANAGFSGSKEAGARRKSTRCGNEDEMSARTCPDWPQLMELAPDLQFKHYSVAEARLPADALSSFSEGMLGELTICCDLEHHVFFAAHTDPAVGEALARRHALVRARRVDDQRPGHGHRSRLT